MSDGWKFEQVITISLLIFISNDNNDNKFGLLILKGYIKKWCRVCKNLHQTFHQNIFICMNSLSGASYLRAYLKLTGNLRMISALIWVKTFGQQ